MSNRFATPMEDMGAYIDTMVEEIQIPYPSISNALGMDGYDGSVKVRGIVSGGRGLVRVIAPDTDIKILVQPDGDHLVRGTAKGARLNKNFRFRPADIMGRGVQGDIIHYIEDMIPTLAIQYQVQGDDGSQVYKDQKALLRDWQMTGMTPKGGRTRKELQGQPVLRGLVGPMYNGRKGDVVSLRYESPEINRLMSMAASLRSKVIRLAASRPDMRPHLLPLVKTGSARVNSVADGIEQGCLAMAEAIGGYVQQEMGNDIKTFHPATIQGPFQAGFEAVLVNQIESNRTGWLSVKIVWGYGKSPLQMVLVISYPGYHPLQKTFDLDINVTEGQSAFRYGRPLLEWVDHYLMDVTKAYNKGARQKSAGKITISLNNLSVEDIDGMSPLGKVGQVAYLDRHKTPASAVKAAIQFMRAKKSELESQRTGDAAIGMIEEYVYKMTGKNLRWQYIQLPM